MYIIALMLRRSPRKGQRDWKSSNLFTSELEANELVIGAVLDVFAKCDAVDEAFKDFNESPERDLGSWTSMITAYGSHGRVLVALKLFGEMQRSNAKLDSVTFISL